MTFNNIIANDIRRRNSIGYEGCSMKGFICSRSLGCTNGSVRVGNEKMNRPIVDQTPSPKKEALPKRGDADSADHIVRAYSPITTASHSIHSSNPITPSPKTCFRKRMHSHHCNSQDPSPLTTIASDRVEKQKAGQLLQSQEQSTIPRTHAQAWLNLTRRFC